MNSLVGVGVEEERVLNTDVIERELLESLDELGPAARQDLEHELRSRLDDLGLPGQKAPAIVTEALRAWATADLPLVSAAWDPADLDPLSRPREGAAKLWELTDAGEQELARLRRAMS